MQIKLQQISSLLSGKRNDNSKKFQDILIGRHQGISKFLVGKLNDADKDKVPDRFDCSPNNPKLHAAIPPQLQAQRPQPLPTKAQTVAQTYAKRIEPTAVQQPAQVIAQEETPEYKEYQRKLQEYTAYVADKRAYEMAEKFYAKGIAWSRMPKGSAERKYLRELYKNAARTRSYYASKFIEAGLKPVYDPSTRQISGFEDVKAGVSVPIEKAQVYFEKKDIVEVKKPVYTFSQLEKKYSNIIKDNQFTGTQTQYGQYKKDYSVAEKNLKPSLYGEDLPFREQLEFKKQKKEEVIYFEKLKKESPEYTAQLAMYKAQGYSNKEAEALAEYSYGIQETPSPERAVKYLRGYAPSERTGVAGFIFGKIGIAPEEQGFARRRFFAEKSLGQVGKATGYAFTKAGWFLNVPFETAYDYFGVSEEKRGLEFTYAKSPVGMIFGGGIINIEPRSLIGYRERVLSSLSSQPQTSQIITSKDKAITKPSIIDKSIEKIKTIDIINPLFSRGRTGLAFSEGEAAVLGATAYLSSAAGVVSYIPRLLGVGFTAGSTGRAIGGYSIAKEVGISPVAYYGKSLKERPLATIIDTAVIASAIYGGVSAGKRYLTKPRIETKQILTSPKIEEPIGFVTKPTQRRIYINEQGKMVVEDIGIKFKGVAQQVRAGRYTTVTTRLRQAFRMKPIYEGIPIREGAIKVSGIRGDFTIPVETSYQKALKLLIKEGYTSTQAKNILRYTKPVVKDITVGGTAKIVHVEGEPLSISVVGKRITKPIVREVEVGKTRGGEGVIEYFDSSGQPFKTIKERELFKFLEKTRKAALTKEGYPYTKISSAGKIETTTQKITAMEELKGNKIFAKYREASISQAVIPAKRATGGTAKVFVQKGEPTFIITDETVSKTFGFGGGKPSVKPRPSPKLLQVAKTEEILSSQVSSLIPKVKPASGISFKTIPSQKIVSIPKSNVVLSSQGIIYADQTQKGKYGDLESQRRFSSLGVLTSGRLDTGVIGGLEEREKVRTGLLFGNLFDVTTDRKLLTFQAQFPAQISAQAVAQVTQQVQKQIVPPIISGFFPGEQVPRYPAPPVPPPTEPIPGIDLGKKKKGREGQAYDAEVLLDATNLSKRRWVQVADNADYKSALGYGASFTDNSSLSRRFRVVPDKGDITAPQNDAWSRIGYKFRNWIVRKGSKIKSGNTFYEKSAHALDTPQERGQIQEARASALLVGGGISKGRRAKSLRRL